MKRLPLAVTTFEKIRDKEKDYLYVDKTAFAYQLIERGEYYFLSRPRRFGKSLFIDTLSDLFQGKQSLFEGLAVYDQWDWETRYPVINVTLNSGDFGTADGIKQAILDQLALNQKRLGVACENKAHIPACFTTLIENAYEKYQQKVVILIDEYDKPMLDNMTNKGLALAARDILKTFYSVIKNNDRYLKFVLITGVSTFSKMNLFSGLNNLTDITIRPEYAAICGYTHDDIQTTFKAHLVGVDLDTLQQWYNGYNYLGGEQAHVYNPYDILLFIDNHCEYKDYWWETGNPSFLIQKLSEQPYYIPNLENIVVNDKVLNTFDIEHIDLIALLWQTGYLTFANKIQNFDETYHYQLKVPNREIQKSLNQLFLNYLTNQPVEALANQNQIYTDITTDLAQLKRTFTSIFAAIPYNNYANNVIARYEGYYASVVFTYLMSLGFPCIAEDVTQKGRIDITLKLPQRILILEFKVDQKGQALAQIKHKQYAEKYYSEAERTGKDIYIVGICFDSGEKNITEFVWEKVSF